MIKSEMTHGDIPRRRGRPAGKNRVPLSQQERRARNAQYERERRTETAEAMTELAAEAGCDPSMANAELLATVISKLQRASQRNSSDDLDQLRRINENLMMQITTLEDRLMNESPSTVVKIEHQQIDPSIHTSNCERPSYKRCLSEPADEHERIPKLKIIKTEQGLKTEVRTAREIKQEMIHHYETSLDCNGQAVTTCTDTTETIIENHIYEPKVESEVLLQDNAPIIPSIQQETNPLQMETLLPYIEQNNTENPYQLQPRSSLDFFPDTANGLFPALLDSDHFLESENIFEMRWSTEDLLQGCTL